MDESTTEGEWRRWVEQHTPRFLLFARQKTRTEWDAQVVTVADPNPRLTAHDKAGKLIFDGEIQTAEQRDKVPRDLWNRVEPLLDKMNSKPESEE